MITGQIPVAPENVAAHYNELDRYYRQIWGEHVHHGLWITGDEDVSTAVLQLSAAVAQKAELKEGDTVCDIGCGYGGTSQYLADQFGAHVTGITVSEDQFAVASRRHSQRGHLEFKVQDWLANDLVKDDFDVAIAIESSEHMTDKSEFFRQAYRVLRPGGRMVICAWCAAEQPKAWEVRHLLVPICEEGRLPSLLSPSEYREGASHVGFEVLETKDLTRQVEKTWPLIIKKMALYFVKNPARLVDLLPSRLASADFAPSLLRIALAYRTGAMSYQLITLFKPLTPQSKNNAKP